MIYYTSPFNEKDYVSQMTTENVLINDSVAVVETTQTNSLYRTNIMQIESIVELER